MSQVVQSTCPKCHNVLRIPAEWLGQAMRCKHCGEAFQARVKNAAPASPVYQAGPPAKAPAPGIPVGIQKGLPASPCSPGGGDPFSFDNDAGPPPSPRGRRRKRGSWWKVLLLAAGLLGIGTGVFFIARPHLGQLFSSSSNKKDGDKFSLLPKKDPDKDGENETRIVVKDKNKEKKIDDLPKEKEIKLPRKKEKEKAKEKEKDQEKEKDPVQTKKDEPGPITKKEEKKNLKNLTTAFPRRALLISVNNYLFANSVQYGYPRQPGKGKNLYPGSSTEALRFQMPYRPLHIPALEIFELSDGAKIPHSTLKPVIENTIKEFLDTSRAQDRIILLFAGHAVEIDQEAYLVPLEGDMKEPKTLIPLSWLYDKLAKCLAWQKVLILDVCRFPPARGYELPGEGEMGDVLDAKLQNPPPNVQVWSSCVKGQQSYEFEKGSVFLQALCASLQERQLGIQDQVSALPLESLVEKVNQKMKELLDPEKLQQTSRLSGKAKGTTGPFDPGESLADAVVIRPPNIGGGKFAGLFQVNDILRDIERIPQVRAMRRGDENLLKISFLPPFLAENIKEFPQNNPSLKELEAMKDDDLEKLREKYPLRVAVASAAKVLNENARFKMEEKLYNPGGPINKKLKDKFLQDQKEPGIAIFNLRQALAELKKAGAERDKEPSRRWQAHYDYTMARLMSRLVYTYEYSFILGQVRGDNLPELNPAIHNGWRVASRAKVQVNESEVKELVRTIAKTWKKITDTYPGTPWAVMAKRESMTALGLEWRPNRD